jgi:glycerol-3-phosphate dehydrogenase
MLSWSPMSELLDARRRILDDAEEGVRDTVVVGGGINGAGALLDAAARGLDALLIERDDLAVGTSSRSSKLIHGGLRYLEHFRFGLVREALRERDLLTRLAPHLVTLRRFVVPVVGAHWQLPYIAAGLVGYDALGGRRGGRFRPLDRESVEEQMPAVDLARVVGGFEYTDGVCDDARVVIAVAETARRRGGRILTHAEATSISEGDGGWTLTVEDGLSGQVRTVRARTVVDVTGAFEVERERPGHRSVTASRGIHLVLAGDRLPGARGLTIRVPGRVVFVIPWGRRWLVGTTDEPHTGPVDRPAATAGEVDYLLDAANELLSFDLTRADVLTTFAGIRPLAGAGQSETVEASREHRVLNDGRGLVTVRGGKYTTYRVIAAEAIDEVMAHIGGGPPSTTSGIDLVGAASPHVLEATVHHVEEQGLSSLEARWLVGRHGVEAGAVVEAGRENGLSGRLHPDMPYLAAEAWWAVHREGGLTLDDVLARRTRLAIETPDHGAAAAPIVADVLASALGWSEMERSSAIDAYLGGARAEYGIPEGG